MIEKLECNCIEAYKTRNMRDPNCCACSCDHNELVEKLEKANERVEELESYNVKLANESHEYQQRCEKLEKEITNRELLHVGFTNGTQVKYAKVEEGAFYPDTAGDCYIPLYMLKSHEHRIETTSIEQLRKEQCFHDWVSADNEVVSGGLICTKCNVIASKRELRKEQEK